MQVSYFYMTSQGCQIAEKLNQVYPGRMFDKTSYKQGIADMWHKNHVLVFIMASGIVVRHIAPYIRSKVSDPAVLVIDQAGQYVISLLSGHLGGGNEVAKAAAEVLGARPVITTATDVAKVPAMDMFAKNNGLTIQNIQMLKYISSAMIEKQPLTIVSQWPVCGEFPENVHVYMSETDGPADTAENDDVGINGPCVVAGTWQFCAQAAKQCLIPEHVPVLYLTAPVYVVGTGCKKDMDAGAYEAAFKDFVCRQGIDVRDMKGLATIELKKEEPCIHYVQEKYQVPLLVFDKAAVESIDLDNASGRRIEASAFVQAVTGVGSVSEACAYLGAGCGEIIQGKTKYKGITFALAREKKVLYL